jgi:hypothetical protein
MEGLTAIDYLTFNLERLLVRRAADFEDCILRKFQ